MRYVLNCVENLFMVVLSNKENIVNESQFCAANIISFFEFKFGMHVNPSQVLTLAPTRELANQVSNLVFCKFK